VRREQPKKTQVFSHGKMDLAAVGEGQKKGPKKGEHPPLYCPGATKDNNAVAL
jgi:hypothetical protein